MSDRSEPDFSKLITDSLEAITAENTGRPIRCCCGCNVVYLRAATYMRHQSRLL